MSNDFNHQAFKKSLKEIAKRDREVRVIDLLLQNQEEVLEAWNSGATLKEIFSAFEKATSKRVHYSYFTTVFRDFRGRVNAPQRVVVTVKQGTAAAVPAPAARQKGGKTSLSLSRPSVAELNRKDL